MKITKAEMHDAKLIHNLMIRAYAEYKHIPASSTALDETVETVTAELENGEQGLILYIKDAPVAAVRYHIREEDLFFSRLSVLPEQRGKGLAKILLEELEKEAIRHHKSKIRCKVRMSVDKNMRLYESIGYNQYGQTIFPLRGLDIQVAEMEKHLQSN